MLLLDTVAIAATALHHDLTVVTRNNRHFDPTGCKLLNPGGNFSIAKALDKGVASSRQGQCLIEQPLTQSVKFLVTNIS